MIQGISHITLVVKDLEKTTHLLEYIFDAREIYSSGDHTFSISREKYFMINDLWICIMEGDTLPGRTYNHIAFNISDDEFEIQMKRIRDLGLEIVAPRARLKEEGRSIYFYDYDNHLFELHAGSLAERLAMYHLNK